MAISKPLVYIETSVISYLTARPSRDLLTAARQSWTRDWWEIAPTFWEIAISELVIEESGRGDPQAAALRLNALHGIPILSANVEVEILADAILNAGALPLTEPEDALHIAIATVKGAHYLVSWNFAHLVGPDAKLKLLDTIRSLGHTPALLTTPEELLEIIK